MNTPTYKLKIHVTKEVLEKSKNCLPNNKMDESGTGANCAIALAVRDVFPDAWVNRNKIRPFWFNGNGNTGCIYLPKEATHFIDIFDISLPDDRVNINPIEFEVEVPDEIIEKINIDELHLLLVNHPTLELQAV